MVLYDRQWLDDEVFEYFEASKEGTGILVVSDSCHSSTITRNFALTFLHCLQGGGIATGSKARGFTSRKLPKEVEGMELARFGGTIYSSLYEKYRTKKQA
ncbi:MAG: hypothetical protein ABI691_23655 [Ginsengibacter sp.]